MFIFVYWNTLKYLRNNVPYGTNVSGSCIYIIYMVTLYLVCLLKATPFMTSLSARLTITLLHSYVKRGYRLVCCNFGHPAQIRNLQNINFLILKIVLQPLWMKNRSKYYSPNFGHPAKTSLFSKYKFWKFKIILQQLWINLSVLRLFQLLNGDLFFS